MLVTNLNEKQRGKKMEEAVEPLKHINEPRKRHETPNVKRMFPSSWISQRFAGIAAS